MNVDQQWAGFFGGLRWQEQIEHLALVSRAGIILITHGSVTWVDLGALAAPTSSIQESPVLREGNEAILIGVNPLKIWSRVRWQLFLLELPILIAIPFLEAVGLSR